MLLVTTCVKELDTKSAGSPSALHIRSADRTLAVDLDAAEPLCLLVHRLISDPTIREWVNRMGNGSFDFGPASLVLRFSHKTT